MKKFFALLLAVLMVLSVTACDSGDSGDDATTTTAAVSGGDALETNLWTLAYDAGVWTYDEEGVTDSEDYSQVILTIPDGEGYIVNTEIRASIEDVENFRDYLTSYGFDQYEYAENNAYELVKIGGVDCLKQEGNYWGEPCLRYFGRVEGAGATVFIEILGEYEDDRVDALLSGLTFTLTDTDNVDAPWYWEGEAFSAEDKSATVGTVTVNSKWIPFEESVVTTETFEHAVAVVGETAYILSEGALKQYAFDGKSLKFEKDIELEGEYSYIYAADDGSVWVSGFSTDLVCIKDGVQTASYEGTDYVAMHPSGTWGISWFTSSECEKVTISGGSILKEAINFAEVESIRHLQVDNNYIYVGGTEMGSGYFKIFVYNTDGEIQKVLADENGEGLGSVTFMAATKDGFIGMDGNMREVIFWKADGSYIGAVEDADLFSTDYPWFCGSALLKNGNVLTIMTQDRADGSGMELVAFTLGGF